MKVLVTGCAGFIGSHVSEKLINEGHLVVGIDNFDPFYGRNIKEANMKSFINHHKFSFFNIKLPDESLKLILTNHEIDVIIHLAARAGVRPSMKLPASYVEYDITVTVQLFEFAREAGIKHVVFGSSSSVYGNLPPPYREDTRVDKPISNYAAAKASGELFAHVFCSQYGMNITCLRFFTVYGPRQRPEMAIHKFVRQIDHDEEIVIYGDGSSSRDYSYIDDIVDGIFSVMNMPDGFQIFNLGNSSAILLNDLIKLIGKALRKAPQVKYVNKQEGDVDETLADLAKSREILGYTPKISITEGIKRFIEWYKINSN
jgi:UDP-glucuronate 4-epimerase